MFSLLKNQKGIALMMVMSMMTMLVVAVTYFIYVSDVEYRLAKNERERLQAEFLALSAINFLKLQMKLERQFRSTIQGNPAGAKAAGNLSAPLCQQMPLSTAMLRAYFLGAAPAEGGEEGGKKEEEAAEGGEKKGEPAAFAGAFQIDAAKEFLDFEGDFDAVCEDESAKFNLNIFADKNPSEEVLSGVNGYDKAKMLMMSFLSQPKYRDLFPKESDKAIREVARNIADWVDENDRMNEFGNVSTGDENTLYQEAGEFRVKNGKFLTVSGLSMVEGVKDSWLLPMLDDGAFTVYGGDKVNVCLAADDIVAALITLYANSNPDIPDVNPADAEKMALYVSAVKNGCAGVNPNVSEIASALDAALKGEAAPAASTGTAGGSSAAAEGGSSGFANMITTESRYYTFIGTGLVGRTEVKVRAVYDISDPQPARWRVVYWREE